MKLLKKFLGLDIPSEDNPANSFSFTNTDKWHITEEDHKLAAQVSATLCFITNRVCVTDIMQDGTIRVTIFKGGV